MEFGAIVFSDARVAVMILDLNIFSDRIQPSDSKKFYFT
jgi:hypothetical protein